MVKLLIASAIFTAIGSLILMVLERRDAVRRSKIPRYTLRQMDEERDEAKKAS